MRRRPNSVRSVATALLLVVATACQSSDPVELTGTDDPTNQPEAAESDGDGTAASIGSNASDAEASDDASSDNGAEDDATNSSEGDSGQDPERQTVGTDTLPASAPDSFWAITEDTYELVEVDSRSGEILGRFGGWGDPFGECEGEDGCLFQGLDQLAVGADGQVWLADCCEPAVGNLYMVEAGDEFSTDSFVVYGTHPVPSPNGQLVAHSGLEATILSDASGAQQSVLDQEEEATDSPPVRFQPLAWIDDETLVVRATGDLVDNLILFDLSDPSSPERFGPTMGGVLSHTDAAVRADGMIFALARSYGGDEPSDLMGWVFDPSNGDVVAETDLPDDIWDIDYDSTGTFLLTVGEEGIVRFFGAGRSGVLAEGFVAVSW